MLKDYNYSNMTDIVSKQARLQPHAIAIYTIGGTLTYEKLEILVWKMATLLNRNGVRAADVVAMIFNDELILMVVMLAVARIGATVFSIYENTPSILKKKLFEDTTVNFLVTDIHRERGSSLPMILIDFNMLLTSDVSIDFSVRDAEPKSPWLFITGSGSTGKRKIIPVEHRVQIERMRLSLNWLPVSKGDRVATLVHLDHHTSKKLYLEAFSAGMSIVIYNKKKVDTFSLCNTFHVTILHATVFHIINLLKILPEDVVDVLPSVKVLLMGGSSVSNALRKQISETLRGNLYIRYGTNEIGTISVTHPDSLLRIPGSVGKAISGITMEIVDLDLQVVPAGTTGLIRVKSVTLVDGYKNDKEADIHFFKKGWFYPGDLGKLTAEGQLIHLGRADDMMILAGNNIYPVEIEQCITQHPNVEDAAALPIKAALYQDIPICAVTLKNPEETMEQELLDFTYQYLGFRGPKRIVILSAIPRNEQGKLIRVRLMKLIKSYLSEERK